MSCTINIPEPLYRQAAEIAESQHMSVDDLIASTFAEHLAQWERLQALAVRGSREKLLALLDKAPDVEPEEYDRP
jgi:hypothetical protein